MARLSSRPGALVAAGVALTVLALAGCSYDSGSDGADEPTTSQSPVSSESPESAAATDSPSTEESASPTEEATPSIAPAAGPLVSVNGASLHAPEGWQPEDGFSSDQAGAFGPGQGASYLVLQDSESLEATTDLETQVASAQQVLTEKGAKVTRLPDVTLGDDATPAAHLTYTMKGDDNVLDLVLTKRAGRTITIDFTLNPTDVQQSPDLIASVLASFAWV